MNKDPLVSKTSQNPSPNPSYSPFPPLLKSWFVTESADLKVLFLYAIAVGLSLLIVPISVQALVNTIAFGSLLQPIAILAIVVFGFLSLSGVLKFSQLAVIERIQLRIFVRLSLQIASKLTELSLFEIQRNKLTSLTNRFLEISTVQKTIAFLCLEGVALALQLGTSLLLLTLYHPLFLLFSILLVASITLVILWPLQAGLKSAKTESNAKYKMADFLGSLGENHLVYRGNRLTKRVEERANSLAKNYISARQAHFKILKTQHIGSFAVQAFFSAFLLGLGGWLVVKGQLSLGQLVAAEIVVSSLLLSLTKVGKLMENLFDLSASSSKIDTLLDLQIEREDGLRTESTFNASQTTPFALSIEGLTFSGNDYLNLENVSLEIKPGQAIAFTGKNGTGKSTLIELIYGLRDPARGEIRIDGHPIREMSLAEFRSQVSFVQGVQIIEGTVLENIKLDQEPTHLDEIRSLLKEFDLEKTIAGLSEGLNTRLDSTLPPFSKGQLQKLMLVRALAQKPRLLLLDEAIDAIDPETKPRVIDAILKRKNQFTLVVATHSREFAARCDQTYNIEAGTLRATQPTGASENA